MGWLYLLQRTNGRCARSRAFPRVLRRHGEPTHAPVRQQGSARPEEDWGQIWSARGGRGSLRDVAGEVCAAAASGTVNVDVQRGGERRGQGKIRLVETESRTRVVG